MPPNPSSPRSSLRNIRRSPCPVAGVLDLIGDRWSLLILRDLFLGKSRFTDLSDAPERIPTNILTARLGRLRRHGLITTRTIRTGSSRVSYHLTAKGESLRPVLLSLRDWGLRWIKGTRVGLGSIKSPDD